MCTSVPQIAVRFTRMSTSLAPGLGSGTSSSHRPGLASRFTRAFNGASNWNSLNYRVRNSRTIHNRQARRALYGPEMLSVLDLFRIGIGPSSSHTLGPMRIAKRFIEELTLHSALFKVARVTVELQGSLALTGKGHATPKAVVLGLLGLEPETLDHNAVDAMVARVAGQKRLSLLGERAIPFDVEQDIVFAYAIMPELHPNGMHLSAFDDAKALLFEQTCYSTGGGFIATERQLRSPAPKDQIATG